MHAPAPSPTLESPPLPFTTNPFRPWDECEVFCAHNHAAGSARACSWRGFAVEARWDSRRRTSVCPRCRHASLLLVPPGGPPVRAGSRS